MIGRYVPSGLLRLLTLRPCREPFCNERIRCWRWHVEYFRCPTCKRDVSEYDPHVRDVIEALFVLGPVLITEPPKTWTSARTVTGRWREYVEPEPDESPW